jgi:hypothetical protein
MLRKLLLFLIFCSFYSDSFSQTKRISAVKAVQAPVIDGNLDDAAWQNAPAVTDFIQSSPVFGLPASVKKTVRILYDNAAVYIGAYIYDPPAMIRKQLTARDGEQRQDVDYFAVLFDTYNDQQNGFQFLVTPANVQTDAKLNPNASSGFGEFGDRGWDAVWQSNVSIVNDGWIVEMRIPYISLRFAKKDLQTWGLQFLHFTRRNNEWTYWNPIDPNVNGFINQFGKYENLRDIKPPLRLSFSPYVSGGVRNNPAGTAVGTEILRNGGMDVKYGINESFTLDATLIPDFGQVISDNVINNLSPFELKFQDNRPFFTEGTEIFNKAQLFYSRRVGAVPGSYYAVQKLVQADPQLELLKNPSMTQLYNAVKFSGRNSHKLGIGIFNAVTAPMHAEIRDNRPGIATGKRDSIIETEPLTNYNIFVLDQALKNRSSITLTNTNVIRSGAARDANVTAFDWSLYTKNNKYQLKGTARYSKIFGYTPFNGNLNLIDDTIRVNGKLHVKPYDGTSTALRFAKVSGRFQFSAQSGMESNGYDPNDLGFLQTANKVVHEATIGYNQLTATDRFLMYRYSFGVTSRYLYKGYRFSEVNLNASAFWLFKNFWDVTLTVNSYPSWQNDYFDLRTPGRFLRRPPEVTFGVRGSSDSRKRLYLDFQYNVATRQSIDNRFNFLNLGLRYRFSDRFSLSAEVLRQHERNQRGFAFVREANGDPIIGFRDYTDYETVLSGIYNFSSRLNLTMRTRQYLNVLKYQSFYSVDKEGILSPRAFRNGLDENYNIFNVDAFLTWDFRLGSRMIFGWKNWIGDPYAVMSHSGYFDNFRQILKAEHGNELTLKIIYFLDYNQLKRHN